MDSSSTGHGVALELRLEDYSGKEILSSIEQRMRSHVVFLVRVYRDSGMLFGIFGNRLISEYRIVHEASWDAFRREYRLDSEVLSDNTAEAHTETRYFTGKERFLEELFRVRGMEVALPESDHGLYALVQIRVTPIHLVPELRLISLFVSSDEIETPWHRVLLTAANGALE